MLTDLCMLDELAVHLKVQGRMRWSPGTVTRLGRTRSVIGSPLLHATTFIILPDIVIGGHRRCWSWCSVPIIGRETAAFHASAVSNPVLLEPWTVIVKAQ